MKRNGKVIAAMSGGVDSTVAAWKLREQGYDCVGAFMRVGVHGAAAAEDDAKRMKHGCCSPDDAHDAREAAAMLGLPFYALDLEEDFEQIIEYFVDEYARARTPNPCVMCNQRIKFGKLLEFADSQDADFVATGHYARILRGDAGVRLARSLNLSKDQSYVLSGIRREALPRCLFPLGEIGDKAEVRGIAAKLGLHVHDKPDSQEICFVPDDDYKELLRCRRPEAFIPGEVIDSSGKVLGRHEGLASFTIGQRRGLGIAVGHPVYVVKLDPTNNTVVLGPREELLSAGLVADGMNWQCDPPPVDESTPVDIKIRYMHTAARGSIRVNAEGVVTAMFDEPQISVTPGQAAVFYDAEGAVLGGGWIREAVKE